MTSSDTITERELITRREAVLRVTALLGGVALVGGSAFLTGCRVERGADEPFSADDIAFLDEVADTILPTTSTPGAKAAKTGAFMALMVHDSYNSDDQKIFRDGMRKIDDATQKAHNVSFMKATPEQRLAVLTALDRDQRSLSQAQEDESRKRSLAWLNDARKEGAAGTDAGAATTATDNPPTHYFRMMKELALLGYFTSEIGATQALRYVESPGRYDPCVPYTPGEKEWASHA
ncbi:MAG: gluconate 2-dehydrogenase subunit 3 family protein [Gemmatimonadota bacterium]|nr:gluconate 2-dehydrogenase subunit 3 family protein [Gemmatimonadota bacterium]